MKNLLQMGLLLTLGVLMSATLNAQNMNRYITLTVQSGTSIRLGLAADVENTPIKIESGDQVYDISVGTDWTSYQNYTAGSTTMTIYGNIKMFDCSSNGIKLTGLDVSQNTALTTLRCFGNSLSSLDVSQNTALIELSCYNNNFTGLDVSGCTALTRLNCSGNSLGSLDVLGCTALTELRCFNNSLGSLDVSNNIALINLDCSDNNLSSLDVSNNMALTSLKCSNNSLSSLDVSNCTALTELDCSNNSLSSLDASQNTALTELWCWDNSLSSLNVSQNTALKELRCENNSLSSLDVSHNMALTRLWCWDNSLSSLDVSQNTDLTELVCYGNPFSTDAVDALFCSLPDREASDNAVIYILNDASDANHVDVLASNKQNALDKNWAVKYSGYIDIPETTGSYECFDGTNGIEKEASLTLYPNPVSGLLNIESNTTIHKIEVFNFLGQLLDAVNTTNNSYQYHTEKLTDGYYMFKIHTDNGVAVKKVMKE